MAVFSSGEANASTTKVANKITRSVGGVAQAWDAAKDRWVFKVEDALGNLYKWKDTRENLDQASNPSTAQIKDYVYDYLTGNGGYSGVEKTTTTPELKVVTVTGAVDSAPADNPLE